MYSLISLFQSTKFSSVLDVKTSNDKGEDCRVKYIITPKIKSKDKCILYVYYKDNIKDKDNIKVEIYTNGKVYKFYRQPFKSILDKVFVFGTQTSLKKGIKYFIEEWISNLNIVDTSNKYYNKIGNYQSYQTYTEEEMYKKLIENNLI